MQVVKVLHHIDPSDGSGALGQVQNSRVHPSCTVTLGKPDNEPEDAMQVTLDLPEELARMPAHSHALPSKRWSSKESGQDNSRRPKPAVPSDFVRAIRASYFSRPTAWNFLLHLSKFGATAKPR